MASDTPEWGQVKPLLDDPAVSDDQKRRLVKEYSTAQDTHATGPHGSPQPGTDPKELEPYIGKYGKPDDLNYAEYTDSNATEGLKDVVDEAEQHRGQEKQHREAVQSGSDDLKTSRQSGRQGAHGGAGVGNSDELLDSGKPGLRFFRTFVPLYHEIQNDTNDKSKVPQFKQIQDRYDEQRGINFDKFDSVVKALRDAQNAGQKAQGDMSSKLDRVWQSWTGAAADSAQSFFSGKFAPTADDRVVGRVNDSASVLEETIKGVAELVRAKAESVLKMDAENGRLAGKSADDWDTTIQVANATEDDRLLHKACIIWDVGVQDDCDGLNDEVKKKIINECRQMVRENFAKPVEQHCEDFDKLCEDTKKKVDEAWGKLNEGLGQAEEDPFKNPGPEKSGSQQQGGDQQPQGQPGGGSPGGGATGGGSPSGGGAAGGSAGGGTPASPGMPGGAGSPAPGAPGDVPEAPAAAGPGSAGPGRPPEVTVGQGEDAVSLQQPSPDGHTKVTMTGEDGQPKTYDVGPGGGPGAAGENSVQPGPDGKAVIHEGGRTVTLERAPEGGMTVDVNNGDGHPPVHQTVDFGGGPEPGAPAPGALGGPGQNSFGSASGQIPDVGGDAGAGGAGGGGAPGGSSAASAGGGGTAGGGAAGGGMAGGGGQPDLAPGGQSGSGGPPQSPQSTAPAAAAGGAAGGAQGGAQGGGMMGGMGGMGMGGGQGGDQQRSNDSPWRTEGQLFDDGVDPSPVRHRAVLGDSEGEEE